MNLALLPKSHDLPAQRKAAMATSPTGDGSCRASHAKPPKDSARVTPTPPRYPTALQKKSEQQHGQCKPRPPLTMELLDLVEQEGGEQQVDDEYGGGCRVPGDMVPWERTKLLMDE